MWGRAHAASFTGAHHDVVLGAARGGWSAGAGAARVPGRGRAAQPGVPLVALLAPAHRLLLHHRAHGVGAARHAGARVHAFIAENTHFYNQDPKISQISCLTQAWWLGQSLFWAHSLHLGGVPR